MICLSYLSRIESRSTLTILETGKLKFLCGFGMNDKITPSSGDIDMTFIIPMERTFTCKRCDKKFTVQCEFCWENYCPECRELRNSYQHRLLALAKKFVEDFKEDMDFIDRFQMDKKTEFRCSFKAKRCDNIDYRGKYYDLETKFRELKKKLKDLCV